MGKLNGDYVFYNRGTTYNFGNNGEFHVIVREIDSNNNENNDNNNNENNNGNSNITKSPLPIGVYLIIPAIMTYMLYKKSKNH